MAAFSINTNSGGLIELDLVKDRFHGNQLYLHVDQSTNLSNGEGDCSISLTNNEVKGLIAMLNDFLIFNEGVTHVVIAEYLLHEAVSITVDQTKVNPSEIKDKLDSIIADKIKDIESPDLTDQS